MLDSHLRGQGKLRIGAHCTRAIALQDGPVLLAGHVYGEWLSRRQETIQR